MNLALVFLLSLTACSLWQPEAGVAPIGPPQPPTHPRAKGPVETIGQGVIEGQRWKLTAYRSDDGICVDLHMGSGSGGGCGFGRLREDLSISGSGWNGALPDYAQLDGRVSKRVTKLTGRSGDGPEEPLALYGSETLGTYFVAFAPIGASYELTAYDEDGEVVGTRVFTRAELDPEGPLP